MKLLIFLSALANAQVSLLTGSLNNVTFSNLVVAYKGGSITAHLAQRLTEYGLPKSFTDELEEVEDAQWAAVVNSWGSRVDRDLKSDYSVEFYHETIFGELISLESVQAASDMLIELTTAFNVDDRNALENLLDVVVDANYAAFTNAMAAWSTGFVERGDELGANATLTLAVMNSIDAALSGIEDIGLSRSMIRRLAHLDSYIMQYVFVVESFMDANELAYEVYTYAAAQIENAFLTQISEGICQGTMGPFEYLHGWAKAMQTAWGGLLTILTRQDMAEEELYEALFSDTVDGLPAAETAWLMQFGIGDMLEDMESNLDVMSMFFDGFITTPFFELVKGPLCGIADTTAAPTTVPVTVAP